VIVFILFRFTPFLYDDTMILLCADGLTEQDRLAWERKIIILKNDINYWTADAANCQNNVLCSQDDIDKLPEEADEELKKKYQERLRKDVVEKAASDRNVSSFERKLDLELAKGPQPSSAVNSSTASSSTAGVVRNISEVSEIENQGSSQKRNR